MARWVRLREFGPTIRCSWGGWRCKNAAVWLYEGTRRRTVLCDEHYRVKNEAK